MKLYQYILLLLPVSLLSCKKYLDEKSDKSLVVPATLADYQALLDNPTINETITPRFGEASADDYFTTDDNAPQLDYMLYTWRPYEYRGINDWSYGYYPVYVSNLCLEGLQSIPMTNANQPDWKNIKGTSHFIKAYAYLGLLWNFAKAYDPADASTNPGIILRDKTDFLIDAVRASVGTCYADVIANCKEAAQSLPDNALHPLRPSKTAAYALLARTYLSMRIYDSASVYAQKALALHNTLLDYNDLDIAGNPFPKFNSETIFYSELNGSISLPTSPLCYADTVLLQSYESTDLRKNGFFEDAGNGYHLYKGSYTSNPYFFFGGLATDEMYLIRSECLARSGQLDEAVQLLNTLLEKRYQTGSFSPRTAGTLQATLDMILLERRKELVYRGIRWMDIKRLNKEGYAITPIRVLNGETFTLLPNSGYYALPLPQDLIEVTGIPQNE